MKLKTAIKFFRNLLSETKEKSESGVYKKFIAVLLDLENRDLSEKQRKWIEDELETFDLNPQNRKKYFSQKFTEFSKFLKEKLSLLSEGYYTAIGISLGLCFGVAFGAVYKEVSYGLIFGMLIGMAIGRSMDSKAKKNGKVLRTKPD